MIKKIPVEISARHLHLCQEDADILFGNRYNFEKYKQLTQPGEFATKETVNLICGENRFENVRIVGPVREETQVELSISDAKFLKIEPKLRVSGDLENTNGEIVIEGPSGKIILSKGVIIAKRHIHCGTEEAKELCLNNGDIVSIKIEGERGLVFHNVYVRVSDKYKLSMHIDTDEGNAAGLDKIGEGEIII